MALSGSQIDKLGDRLRSGMIGEADLRLLDEYRRTFRIAYDQVTTRVRSELGLNPTGRPAKSTTAIIQKLSRETIRLQQIQDIAGCRIIVDGVALQERIVSGIVSLFPGAAVDDRRVRPSHGYRAVHVIPRVAGRQVEVQVRTIPQDQWAQLCELLSDLHDPMLKYGGGPPVLRDILDRMAAGIALWELLESRVDLEVNATQLEHAKKEYIRLVEETLESLREQRRQKQ